MKRYIAEFIGTFWLVLGGCGSAALSAVSPDVGIGLLGVSLAFGLTVLTIASTSKRSIAAKCPDVRRWTMSYGL